MGIIVFSKVLLKSVNIRELLTILHQAIRMVVLTPLGKLSHDDHRKGTRVQLGMRERDVDPW